MIRKTKVKAKRKKSGEKIFHFSLLISHLSRNAGITFVSVLIAFFILAVGIVTILKVYPAMDNLSGRAKNYVSLSMIADRVFTVIEKVYGDAEGPSVPSFITGVDGEFPRYVYSVWIEEEKQGLYRADMEITFMKEGKSESEYFQESFRRK